MIIRAFARAGLMLPLLAACAAPPSSAPSPSAPAREGSMREDPQPKEKPEYLMPIAGGILPREKRLLPNAVREYRGGVHEGIDLYNKRDGSSILCNEPVINSRAGWVARADHYWPQMTVQEYDRITELLKENIKEGHEERLDRLRGIQVWIKTDDGVLLRYCHLRSVAPSIEVGVRVSAGVTLGYVGDSGTSSSVRGPWRNCHLHFEIWPKPGTYLGKGKTPEQARKLYADLLGEE